MQSGPLSPERPPANTLVFDTGPLRHFARADLLGVVKAVVGERRAIIPEAVVVELQKGVYFDYRIRAVLDADWIERRAIDTDTEAAAFARFAKRLVAGDRNVGESEVLALAETMPATAVVDDSVAHKVAKRASVDCTRTLALLCDATRAGLLTVEYVGNRVSGVQRGQRILKHQLHLAARPTQLALLQVQEAGGVELDGPGVGTLQDEEQATDRRLTRPALADQTQCLPGLDGQADVVAGPDEGRRAP